MKVVLHRKDNSAYKEYVCPQCFAIVDMPDRFCWSCGADMETNGIPTETPIHTPVAPTTTDTSATPVSDNTQP